MYHEANYNNDFSFNVSFLGGCLRTIHEFSGLARRASGYGESTH
jgi:hypothetical protein